MTEGCHSATQRFDVIKCVLLGFRNEQVKASLFQPKRKNPFPETQKRLLYQKRMPIFRNKQDKANEHLLTGAYIDVRDRNKAERNAEMRRL